MTGEDDQRFTKSRSCTMNCTSGCDFASLFSHGSTNFTCQQLSDYCTRYTRWTEMERHISLGVYYSQILAGLFGFVCYILMLLTFRLKAFERPSFVYHKSMVIMEFVHMAVMLQAGIFSPFSFSDTGSFVVYRDLLLRMWVFGDAMKLSVSIVTTFLSMERCIGLWSPVLFARINKSEVAWSFVSISTLVGLLHLSPAFCGDPVQKLNQPGAYTLRLNAYGKSGINEMVSTTIYAIKIVTCIALSIFCLFVAAGLMVKSKKAETMTITAKSKWKSTRWLCILQMVAAVSTLVDHITWVVNKVIKDRGSNDTVELDAVILLSYGVAIARIEHQALYTWTWMVQSVTGELDHCGRFVLYLLFMKKFREAFVSLTKKNEHPAQKFNLSPASRQNRVEPMPPIDNAEHM